MKNLMAMLRRYQPLIISLTVLSYTLCSLTAFTHFPGNLSPTQNWLSDLGDIQQNPTGAIFYNLGIILTGLMVLLFFLSISHWHVPNHGIQNRLVLITQIFGVLGSLALILSAVFPINHPQEHQIASIALYALLGTAFAFSVTALRYQPACPRAVLVIGAITASIDILSGILHEVTVLEWWTVALFLSYLMLLSRFTRRLEGKGTT
jgi:hypothetical membrane protein